MSPISKNKILELHSVLNRISQQVYFYLCTYLILYLPCFLVNSYINEIDHCDFVLAEKQDEMSRRQGKLLRR